MRKLEACPRSASCSWAGELMPTRRKAPDTSSAHRLAIRRSPPNRSLRGFDITQADFVSRIGVSQSYLSAIEHGRNEVGAEVLLATDREFDKSLEWLLTGKE